MQTLLAQRLAEEIQGRMHEISLELSIGRPDDIGDYRHRVGQYKALNDVREWLKRLDREILGLEPEKD